MFVKLIDCNKVDTAQLTTPKPLQELKAAIDGIDASTPDEARAKISQLVAKFVAENPAMRPLAEKIVADKMAQLEMTPEQFVEKLQGQFGAMGLTEDQQEHVDRKLADTAFVQKLMSTFSEPTSEEEAQTFLVAIKEKLLEGYVREQ